MASDSPSRGADDEFLNAGFTDNDGAGDSEKLEKDLKEADLLDVKRAQPGMLDGQYFLKLLQFVG